LDERGLVQMVPGHGNVRCQDPLEQIMRYLLLRGEQRSNAQYIKGKFSAHLR